MLTVTNIETFYGPSQALFGVNLSVQAGELVALMGRNGMGKTTTIRSIFGLTPARRGRIEFEAKDLRRLPAYRIAQAGLGLVPEGRRCFPNLSVRENLMVTARPGDWSLARVEQLFPRLAERRHQMANTLSGGEQQMLAIGRALMPAAAGARRGHRGPRPGDPSGDMVGHSPAQGAGAVDPDRRQVAGRAAAGRRPLHHP